MLQVETRDTIQERIYPYIGESNGCVVLFTAKDMGTCLCVGSTLNFVGDYREMWHEDAFTYCTKEIVLRNE